MARAAAFSAADGGHVLPTPPQPPQLLFEGSKAAIPRDLLLPPPHASQAAARHGPNPDGHPENLIMARSITDRICVEMAGHPVPAQAAPPSPTTPDFSAVPPVPEERVNLVLGEDLSEISTVRAGSQLKSRLCPRRPPS